MYAAKVAVDNGEILAALGFCSVVVAASVGVLRFGVNEVKYAKANSLLADIAAFVGLPAVGLSYLSSVGLTKVVWGLVPSLLVIMALTCVEWLTRAFPNGLRELCKVVINLILFVDPVSVGSYQNKQYYTFGGIILFALAGVVITGDTQRFILGVRCVNWFHYSIGLAAIFIGDGFRA